jgi:hypothetical protein
MDAIVAYQRIVLAINGIFEKDKFLKRINKKYKKKRYFRVPEYEEFIVNDIRFCYLYARDVVHGKLPEPMHNIMIAEAIANPQNDYAKYYFEICKGNFDHPELMLATKTRLDLGRLITWKLCKILF